MSHQRRNVCTVASGGATVARQARKSKLQIARRRTNVESPLKNTSFGNGHAMIESSCDILHVNANCKPKNTPKNSIGFIQSAEWLLFYEPYTNISVNSIH